jgi:surface antigen
MSRRSVRGCLVIMLVIALAGCQAGGGIGQGTAIGGLGGAAAGGLLGAAAGGGGAGIAAGTILGGLLGAGIGHALDLQSQRVQAETVHRTLETAPSGTVSTWANPDEGTLGTVRPLRTYRNPAGDYCREFQQTVTIGGQPQQSYGTACRQPDGTWRMVN